MAILAQKQQENIELGTASCLTQPCGIHCTVQSVYRFSRSLRLATAISDIARACRSKKKEKSKERKGEIRRDRVGREQRGREERKLKGSEEERKRSVRA